MSHMAEVMSGVEVIEYVLDFEEVKVLGEYAFEWGMIRGKTRRREGEEVEEPSYKVMRILRKETDGEWKVHRSIWNTYPGEPKKESVDG
jgi:ketosteroid isomerase-like protein